jgi:hypothetical protein
MEKNTPAFNIEVDVIKKVVASLKTAGITKFKQELCVGKKWVSGWARYKDVDIEVAVSEQTVDGYIVRLAYRNNNFYSSKLQPDFKLPNGAAEEMAADLVNVMYDKRTDKQKTLLSHMYDDATYNKLVKLRTGGSKCQRKSSRKKTGK